MIDWPSVACGAVLTVIIQLLLAILLWKWFNRKRKPQGEEEKELVNGVLERYNERSQ